MCKGGDEGWGEKDVCVYGVSVCLRKCCEGRKMGRWEDEEMRRGYDEKCKNSREERGASPRIGVKII
jgi:hypothetical protein